MSTPASDGTPTAIDPWVAAAPKCKQTKKRIDAPAIMGEASAAGFTTTLTGIERDAAAGKQADAARALDPLAAAVNVEFDKQRAPRPRTRRICTNTGAATRSARRTHRRPPKEASPMRNTEERGPCTISCEPAPSASHFAPSPPRRRRAARR